MLYFALKDVQAYGLIREVVFHFGKKDQENICAVGEETINQRLKFLIEKVSPNAKVFSETINESPTTTHNYIGKRQTEPRAQYLTKVLSHFADVNARWLMTGEGNVFGDNTSPSVQSSVAGNRKISRSLVVGHVAGNSTQNQGAADQASLQREIELLRAQLADKERTIQILLTHAPRP